MARIVRLSESDLTRLVKRVIQEQKKIASFDDELGWYDEDDRKVKPEDFGDDYDEETFDEFEPMHSKHGKDTKWFADDSWGTSPGGKDLFNKYREHTGKPMRIRTRRSMDEEDRGIDELPHQGLKNLAQAVWDSMTTAERKKWWEKYNERKEKGSSHLKPKSSQIDKKDK